MAIFRAYNFVVEVGSDCVDDAKADLPLSSLNRHGAMALPKWDARLETWIAFPVAFARVVTCPP